MRVIDPSMTATFTLIGGRAGQLCLGTAGECGCSFQNNHAVIPLVQHVPRLFMCSDMAACERSARCSRPRSLNVLHAVTADHNGVSKGRRGLGCRILRGLSLLL